MRAIIASEKGAPASVADTEAAPEVGPDEVRIAVTHSSLNFKDAVAISGRGIVQNWPIVLGIDAVGEVVESRSDRLAIGDRVVLNGGGVGESRDGGFAEQVVAPAEAVVRVPERFSSSQVAAIGTAGFTAAIAVAAIEDHGLRPGDGEVLVTGAAGGAGSIAISLLAARGYSVVASTGRAETEGDYLTRLGAARIIDRSELSEPIPAPLQERRWAAVVDGVGSHTLVNAVAQTRYAGIVVSYGMAQGIDFSGTVLPFILRSVTLTGANSVDAPVAVRERAWKLLGEELDADALDAMTTVVGLGEAVELAGSLLAGQVRGRTVVDVQR